MMLGLKRGSVYLISKQISNHKSGRKNQMKIEQNVDKGRKILINMMYLICF